MDVGSSTAVVLICYILCTLSKSKLSDHDSIVVYIVASLLQDASSYNLLVYAVSCGENTGSEPTGTAGASGRQPPAKIAICAATRTASVRLKLRLIERI